MCKQYPPRLEEGIVSARTGVKDGCWPSYRYWELSPTPLEEQLSHFSSPGFIHFDKIHQTSCLGVCTLPFFLLGVLKSVSVIVLWLWRDTVTKASLRRHLTGAGLQSQRLTIIIMARSMGAARHGGVAESCILIPRQRDWVYQVLVKSQCHTHSSRDPGS